MEHHEELRPYLFSIAYRMLGSVAEAKDVTCRTPSSATRGGSRRGVAEGVPRHRDDAARDRRAPLRASPAGDVPGRVAPRSWTTTRLAMRRPPTRSRSCTCSRSCPRSSAVFPAPRGLRLPYQDIARIVDKTPEHCRQILARAHRHVEERRQFDVSRSAMRSRVASSLPGRRATRTGSSRLLAPDATVRPGGGKAPAMPVPLVGAVRVAKALIGWGRQARGGIVHRPALVNGEPGLVFYEPDGRALWVAASRSPTGSSSRSVDPQPGQARARARPLTLRPSVGFDLTGAARAAGSGGGQRDRGAA